MAAIWKCPECGKGARAPQRLRRNDVRRYCLGCSKTTGLLVERETAAAKRRQVAGREKAAKTRARKARDRERERVRSEVVISTDGPVNVVRQAEKWHDRLPALAGWGSSRPDVILRHRSDGSWSGRAGRCRVVLSIGRGLETATIYTLMLHELAHTVAEDHHGKGWRRIYARAVRQAFPGITLERTPKGS